jgi:ATP synthase F1 delta subunit
MNQPAAYIARRYAKAFLDLYRDKLHVDDLEKLSTLEQFLMTNKPVLSLLNALQKDSRSQTLALEQLLTRFEVTFLIPVARLLLKARRMFLLPELLKQLCRLYQKWHKIMFFTVTCSRQLASEELAIIRAFLTRLTGLTVICTTSVDKNLIAGIRLQSDTLLWEYSLAKQMRLLKRI